MFHSVSLHFINIVLLYSSFPIYLPRILVPAIVTREAFWNDIFQEASFKVSNQNVGVVRERERFLQIQRKGWNAFQQLKVVSLVVKVKLIVILALLLLGVLLGLNVKGAHAQSYTAHTVQTTYVAHTNNVVNSPPTGSYNWFPYPWCTWWADQRYHELHGVYVPWRTQSDAWEWTARAYQFGWHVSSRPTVGAIINLQPWVQGAYGLGHVGVVEQVYSDGSVLASNTSWGSNPYVVVYWHFYQGSGVTFITW